MGWGCWLLWHRCRRCLLLVVQRGPSRLQIRRAWEGCRCVDGAAREPLVVHARFEGWTLEVGEVLKVLQILRAVLHVVFNGLLYELFGTSLRVQVAAVGGGEGDGAELYFVIVVLCGVQPAGACRFDVVRAHHSSTAVQDHQVAVI